MQLKRPGSCNSRHNGQTLHGHLGFRQVHSSACGDTTNVVPEPPVWGLWAARRNNQGKNGGALGRAPLNNPSPRGLENASCPPTTGQLDGNWQIRHYRLP